MADKIMMYEGETYGAFVDVPWYKRSFATDERITSELVAAGFTRITVTRTSAKPWVTGVWSLPTQLVEIPEYLTDARLIPRGA